MSHTSTAPVPPSASVPKPAHAYTPYVPAHQSPTELTFRGLILGAVLGIVFAASSVYLAVKVGMTVSASIPIAVLSIAIFRAVGKSSILENTIVQTTGSAGESLAFGVAAALPALLFLGYDIELVHAFLVAALGGVLGVLMMIPLRHGLIVQEHGKLMYPEGTACADVLIVGEQGGTNAKTVIAGFIAGIAYKLAYAGLKLWREVISTPLSWLAQSSTGATVKKGLSGGSFSMEVSPELLGVGYIIGLRVAGITFAGGVLSYLILIPAITFFGSGLEKPLVSSTGTLIRDMSPDAIRDAYVLYIGAGAVATGGLISLVRSFPTIISAFRRGVQTFLDSRRSGSAELPRTEQDLPITVVIAGSLALVFAIWLSPPLHVNFVSAVLMIICGFFFVTVSSRITGEIGSSSNPISGMVVATLLLTCLCYLLLGWTAPSDRFMALTTSAIVGIAASNGGTTAQDLKTAYLVGGTPKRQQLALFVGVLSSAAFIGGTLWLLNAGATAIIPEAHPSTSLTTLSEERMTQRQWAFSLNEAALESRGVTTEELARALWSQGLELIPAKEGGTAFLRTFESPDLASLQALTLISKEGIRVQLSELGPLQATPDNTYRVGFARGDTDVPAGKYLVNDQNQVDYLVDPGIGGRVTEHLGKKYPHYGAPKARLFSLIIDGILTQKLPWDLVLLGVFIALMLELCGVSSLPFAVGVYLPISTSAPIFVGGVVRYLVDRRRGGATQSEAEAEFSPGVLLSSGYIAGGAIAGVALAMIALPQGGAWLRVIDLPHVLKDTPLGGFLNAVGESEHQVALGSNLWALVFFGLLAFFLLRTGVRGESGSESSPQAPHPPPT